MKGLGYFGGLYGNLMEQARYYRKSLAELFSPVPQHPLTHRHNQGLHRVIVNVRLESVEEADRPSDSDLTTVFKREPKPLINWGNKQTEGQATPWTMEDVVTRNRLPDGGVAITLAYLAPDSQEEQITAPNPRFMLHEH